jgi:glutathione synthase/RimK-type ligase-like ATP-grasp enzyme
VILAVSHRGDEHARAVLGALARRGAAAELLDLADLPAGGRLALAFGAPGPRRLLLEGQLPIDADRITALWWRRPRPPRPPPGLPAARAERAARHTLAAVAGLVASLEGRALLVNHPWRDDAAGEKVLQLAAAARCGLRVPRTLVTSDPEEAAAFLAATGRGGAVHKAVVAAEGDWRRTRRVGRRGAAGIRDLRHAPAILQERVPGVDVRVTAVGDELFAAEIDARRSSSPDDYRGVERECRFAACRVPAEVRAGLGRLLRALGLRFGAADFRRGPGGAWRFLELNPAGQWLFVEQRTGQPISDAVAALLDRGTGGSPSTWDRRVE